MKKIILFLVAFCSVHLLQAQMPWSLQECIEYALKGNVNIRQAEVNSLLAKNNLLQSKLNMLPGISGDASYNMTFGNSIDPTTYAYVNSSTQSNSYSLTANLALFTGLQQVNAAIASKYSYLASQKDYENAQRTIGLNVATLYLQILMNEELQRIAGNQLDLSKSQKERVEALIKQGLLAEGSLYESDAQVARDEQNLLQAENAVMLAKLALKNLLQLPAEQSFNVVKPETNTDINASIASAAQVYSIAFQNDPSVQAAQFRIKSAEKNISISKGAFSPTLSAFARIGTNWFSEGKEISGYENIQYPVIGRVEGSNENVYSVTPTGDLVYKNISYKNQLDNNLSKSIGLSLNVPLFSKWNRVTNLNNAKLQKLSADLALETTQNQLKNDVYNAYANAQAAQKSFAAAEKSLGSARNSFEFAQKRFEAGVISQYELNSAQNAYAIAQSNHINAKYEYLFRLKILDFYQNKSLF